MSKDNKNSRQWECGDEVLEKGAGNFHWPKENIIVNIKQFFAKLQ